MFRVDIKIYSSHDCAPPVLHCTDTNTKPMWLPQRPERDMRVLMYHCGWTTVAAVVLLWYRCCRGRSSVSRGCGFFILSRKGGFTSSCSSNCTTLEVMCSFRFPSTTRIIATRAHRAAGRHCFPLFVSLCCHTELLAPRGVVTCQGDTNVRDSWLATAARCQLLSYFVFGFIVFAIPSFS